MEELHQDVITNFVSFKKNKILATFKKSGIIGAVPSHCPEAQSIQVTQYLTDRGTSLIHIWHGLLCTVVLIVIILKTHVKVYLNLYLFKFLSHSTLLLAGLH